MSSHANASRPETPDPAETARYTEDMLKSLKKIAERQQQPLLAHLLGLAAVEAQSLVRQQAASSGQ